MKQITKRTSSQKFLKVRGVRVIRYAEPEPPQRFAPGATVYLKIGRRPFGPIGEVLGLTMRGEVNVRWLQGADLVSTHRPQELILVEGPDEGEDDAEIA